jgi:vancomycin resistance protein YoaR
MALAIVAAIAVGFVAANIIVHGIEYVIAADIHPTIIDPTKVSNNAPYIRSTPDDPDITPKIAPHTEITPGSNAPGLNAPSSADAARPDTPSANAPSVNRPPATKILGEYSTEFSSGPKSRNLNIKLAAQAIDNTIVMPGETFSYNDTVGPTNKENGYQRAQIFVRGTKSYGYGGGVCQVSSTLYNAVDEAGLKVVERHNHSLPVSYVPKGKDAATSYGSIDFQFTNTLSYPVEINASVSDNSILVQIVSS